MQQKPQLVRFERITNITTRKVIFTILELWIINTVTALIIATDNSIHWSATIVLSFFCVPITIFLFYIRFKYAIYVLSFINLVIECVISGLLIDKFARPTWPILICVFLIFFNHVYSGFKYGETNRDKSIPNFVDKSESIITAKEELEEEKRKEELKESVINNDVKE